MARTLKNSRANPRTIDADDAFNRAVNRGEDISKDREDPQPGPLENRRRAASRTAPK